MIEFQSLDPTYHGECTIVKQRIESDKLVPIETTTTTNIINKRSVELLFNNIQVFTSARRIAISTDNYTSDFERIVTNNVIAIGDPNLSGVTGYTYTEQSLPNPRFVTFHNRFIAPVSQRTFRTIAIVDGTTNNNVSLNNVVTYAYLSLPANLTQQTNEVYDIYYKVYITWTNPLINLQPQLQEILEYLFLGQVANNSIEYSRNNIASYITPHSSTGYIELPPRQETNSFTPTITTRLNQLKLEYSGTFTFARYGTIYYGLSYGRLESIRWKSIGGRVPFTGLNTIGNVFSHSADATCLFYDANKLASSTWRPYITDVSNLDDFPSLYILKVETSGGLGVGTYSIYKSLFSQNIPVANYSIDSLIPAAFTGGDATCWSMAPSLYAKGAIFPYIEDVTFFYDFRWVYDWKEDHLIISGLENKGVGLINVRDFKQEAKWSTAEGLTISKIYDLATDPNNDFIYVAAEEGLIRINANTNAITTLNSDKCVAVDVGFGGAVFAVFINSSNVGRLSSSIGANWTTSLSFSGTIVWQNVVFIRVNRSSSNYNLAILEMSGDSASGTAWIGPLNTTFTHRIHFWNNVSNYVSTFTSRNNNTPTSAYFHKDLILPTNNSFIVKDGIWAVGDYYNSTSITLNNNVSTGAISVQGFNAVLAAGVNINTATANRPEALNIALFLFNQRLRLSPGYITTGSRMFHPPSLAFINTDYVNNGGSVDILCTGFRGNSLISSNYGDGAGIFSLPVSETTPTSTIINTYKNTTNRFYNFASGGIATSTSSGATAELVILSGNAKVIKTGILLFPAHGYVGNSVSNDNRNIRYGPTTNPKYSPVTFGLWGQRRVEEKYTKPHSLRYGWNSGTSQWEISDVLPGKPIHTTTDNLIDGLQINWVDLQVANTRNLVANQFYTFTKTPKGGLVADNTLSNTTFRYSYYLRPVEITTLTSTTIPATPFRITVPPAPTGSSPDPLFLTLEEFQPEGFNLSISGYATPATIIFSGTPLANQIKVHSAAAGVLEFAAVDTGKTVSGTYLQLRKIHVTEIF